jgi:hypothetical protein
MAGVFLHLWILLIEGQISMAVAAHLDLYIGMGPLPQFQRAEALHLVPMTPEITSIFHQLWQKSGIKIEPSQFWPGAGMRHCV